MSGCRGGRLRLLSILEPCFAYFKWRCIDDGNGVRGINEMEGFK